MTTPFLRFVLPLAAFALFAPAGLSAQKNATPPSGPTVIPGGTVATTYVINQPGSYVLGGNRLLTDRTKHVIEITAPDVTLDLGGFSIGYPAGTFTTGIGVLMTAAENVEIRNGSVVNPPASGICAESGSGLRVLNVRVTSAQHSGILTLATGSQIAQCNIADSASGIMVAGAGSLVTDCSVTNSVDSGIRALKNTRVVRSTTHGGKTGIFLMKSSSAVDCSVAGASMRGIYAAAHTTIRGVDVMENGTGVYCEANTVVIMSSRISNNSTSVQNAYINGGGNVIQ
jgi:hypothetical protein